MITESSIRDRFVICLKEISINNTLKEIALKSGTSESYLSQLKKKDRKIPPSVIGNFCIAYQYSATWILTGQGERKITTYLTTEQMLIEQNVKLVEIIRNLTK